MLTFGSVAVSRAICILSCGGLHSSIGLKPQRWMAVIKSLSPTTQPRHGLAKEKDPIKEVLIGCLGLNWRADGYKGELLPCWCNSMFYLTLNWGSRTEAPLHIQELNYTERKADQERVSSFLFFGKESRNVFLFHWLLTCNNKIIA